QSGERTARSTQGGRGESAEQIERPAQLLRRRPAKDQGSRDGVLQRDPGTVEQRDLILALSTGLLARRDRAEVGMDCIARHRTLRDRMMQIADARALVQVVDDNLGSGE